MSSPNENRDDVVSEVSADAAPSAAPRRGTSRRAFLQQAAATGAAVTALLYLPEDASADVPASALKNLAPEELETLLKNRPQSMLDEVGHLTHVVPAEEAARWKAALRAKNLPARHAALLHLWLGEYALTTELEPELALTHFGQAKQLTVNTDRLHGWACYNIGIARVYNSQWNDAISAFRWCIYHDKPALTGFPRHNAALWLRHAQSCAAYNNELADLGIPRPPKIDVLCVAGGFAACLRALKLPYDKRTVKSLVRVTGRGSRLKDALDACDKWNQRFANDTTRPRLVGRALYATEQGLKALPKPLIAFVEREHFVAVIDADDDGVVYQCTDCGVWPGGRVSVTWKQWRAMKPGIMASIVAEGSEHDRLLTQVFTDAERAKEHKTHIPGIQVAMNPHRPGEQLTQLHQLSGAYVQLANNVTLATISGSGVGSGIECGFTGAALHCLDRASCCPKHGVGPGGGGAGPGGGGAGGGGIGAFGPKGSSAGDPVNLSTLEEEYTPDPDLVVYNTIGPAVVWSRIYNSLRGNDLAYQNGDFGQCWSHPYNYVIYDPNATTVTPPYPNGTVPRGGTGNITPNGTSAPASGVTWDILLNGTSVATSSSGQGTATWTVTKTTDASNNVILQVKAPGGATTGSGYTVRYTSGGGGYSGYPGYPGGSGGGSSATNYSGTFSVTADGVLYRGEGAYVPKSGSTAPAGSLTWQVFRNGNVIAASDSDAGWQVGYSAGSSNSDPNSAYVVPAPDAPLGSGYELRVKSSSNYVLSGNFTVNERIIVPTTGTKYVIFPNGARASFVNPSVPTAQNPTVACTTQAGVPLYITMLYDAQDTGCRYVVWFADGSRLESTRVQTAYRPGSGGQQLFYGLDRMVDKVGNAIQMVYGPLRYSTIIGGGKFPLLSGISDGAGQPLVLFTRDGSDGFITQVADRYGRSVYYQKVLLPTNSYYSPTHRGIAQVSQIVATGANNPPMRYQYGYSYVYSGIGSEQAQLLTSITVPSPTGTGTSTTTIAYQDYSCYVKSITDANGNKSEFTQVNSDGTPFSSGYNSGSGPPNASNNTRVTVKDPQGNVVYSYYVGFDQNMNATKKTDGAGQIISQESFNASQTPYRPSQTTDGMGRIWSYTWDAWGNMTSVVSPRGTTTTYTWNYTAFPLGRLTQVQEGSKTATAFTYNEPSGLISTMVRPKSGGGTVVYQFDYSSLGNMTAVHGPGNGTAQSITVSLGFTADGSYTQPEMLGCPITMTDALGHVTHMRYDNQGNCLAVQDPSGNAYSITYNRANHVASTIFPPTGQTGAGNGGISKNYLYVGGPLMSEQYFNENGNSVPSAYVTYVYGPEGELRARTGWGEAFQYAYDANYRLVSLTDSANHSTAYTYNTQGYPYQVLYPGGDSVQFTSYNAAGQVLQRVDGRGQVANYAYATPDGLISSISYPASPASNTAFSYDAYGRKTGVTDGAGTYQYSYGDLDELLSTVTTYNGLAAKTISYSYWSDGSRSTMTTPAGTFAYTWDGQGRLSGLSNPLGENTTWQWYDNDWLQRQTATNGLSNVYAYTALGQMLNVKNTMGSGAQPSVLCQFVIPQPQGYDAGGNMLSVTSSSPVAPGMFIGSSTFQYDSKNQLTSELSTRLNGFSNNYGYDTAGNLTSFRGQGRAYNANNQLTAGAGLGSMVYDANGNPTTYNGTTCQFDAENHLVVLGSVFAAGYRSDGLRAWKQNGSGAATFFLYDGNTPVVELDGTGNVKALNTFGIQGLISRTTFSGAPSSVFYGFDERGNTSVRTDAQGTVLSWHTSDAYGTSFSSSAQTSDDPFAGFMSQLGSYRDGETGFVLCTFRYFDPAVGRWINRDPIRYSGGINLYAYSDNNPVGLQDPSGLSGARPPRPTRPTRPCGDTRTCSDEEYAAIRAAIFIICKVAGPALGGCKAYMDCGQLERRIATWFACAVVRIIEVVRCWEGGDDGHRQQIWQVLQIVNKCIDYWKLKGCDQQDSTHAFGLKDAPEH